MALANPVIVFSSTFYYNSKDQITPVTFGVVHCHWEIHPFQKSVFTRALKEGFIFSSLLSPVQFWQGLIARTRLGDQTLHKKS